MATVTNNSNVRVEGSQYANRDESFGGTNPLNDQAHKQNDNQDLEHKLNQRYVNLGDLYRPENMNVHVVDVKTGEAIPIYSISDSIRLARGGNNVKNDQSIVYHNFIPDDILGRSKISNTYHYNARSSVEALGLYISDLIEYQATHLGDKNSDLSAVEDKGIINDLTFRNYVRGGGAAWRNVLTGEAERLYEEIDPEGNLQKRTWSEDLGIGLGECMVLNPVFQFNKRDDVRTNPMYTKIGRVYSTQIMNNWPVVIMQPGRLKYNTGFFKLLGLGGGAGAAETFIRTGGEGIAGKLSGFFSNVLDALHVVGTVGSAIFGGSKLVEFRDSSNLFKMYSRSLYHMLSQMMGLWSNDKNGKYTYNGSVKLLDLTHILPTLHMSGGFRKYLTNQYIPFRVQKGCTGSETFSNATDSNPLMDDMNATATQNAEEGASNNSFLARLTKKAISLLGNFSDKAAVLSGQGRITLPDVYSSSSFSRSINLNFEFHYPYGDALGKFENTLLQFLTLLTMGLARQTGKMTYTSPFAVRLYIKNHIFINYGMIESISVTRGGDSNDWCSDGYPKTLKVDVTVKDMEPNISLPLASRGPLRLALEVMFPTSGISEYLGSIGGLSMDEMTHTFRKNHFKRAVNIFRSSWSHKLNPDNMLATVANTRIVSNILQLFGTSDIEKMNKLGDINGMYTKEISDSMGQNSFVALGVGQLQAIFDNGPNGSGSSALSDFKASQAADYPVIEELGKEMDLQWNN